MEIQFTSFTVLLSTTILSLLLFTYFIITSSKRSISKLPPGPKKLPFIGNLHNLMGALPHHVLRDLSKKYGPLIHLQLGQVPAVVASSPEMAEAIMKTHDLIFATRPPILITEIMMYGTKDLVFAPYGEFWRMVRKICTSELLSKKRVQSFGKAREEECLDLARWVESNAGNPVNLSEEIFSMSYKTTSRIAFGKRCKGHDEFISIIEEMLRLGSGFNIGDMYPSYKMVHVISGMRPKLQRLHERADEIMEGIIKEHRDKLDQRSTTNNVEEDHDDLIDVLLLYERSTDREFTLTTENVKAIIVDIFTAGSDTSATTTEWALSEMMRNLELFKKAQSEVRKVFEGETTVNQAKFAELKFLKMVIKETLRLHPAAPLLIPRECREKCEINGYVIPKKTKVIVNAWAINRDPRYWENADMFDPVRFQDSRIDFRGSNFEFIPFGAGRRICPGIDFGLANTELHLAMLLYHFDWELPETMRNEDLDMTEWFGATGKRKESLYLIPASVYRVPPSIT